MDANCNCGHGFKCHVNGHCHLCEGNGPEFMQPDHGFVATEFTEHTRPCPIHYPNVNGYCSICGRPAH